MACRCCERKSHDANGSTLSIQRVRALSEPPSSTVGQSPISSLERSFDRLISTPVFCPRFVGRRRELTFLIERRRDLAQTHGGLVLVGGDAGIGKSRLVREFLDRTGKTRWRQPPHDPPRAHAGRTTPIDRRCLRGRCGQTRHCRDHRRLALVGQRHAGSLGAARRASRDDAHAARGHVSRQRIGTRTSALHCVRRPAARSGRRNHHARTARERRHVRLHRCHAANDSPSPVIRSATPSLPTDGGAFTASTRRDRRRPAAAPRRT